MGEGIQAGGGHLVILVHGINTRALWMDAIKPALEDEGFLVEGTSYGEYSAVRFLLPFGAGLRRKALERVVTDINSAISVHHPAQISVISHSFGTFLLSRIIAEHFEFKWCRIIFCGSVVREDFPIEQYTTRFEPPLINEIGTGDYWPALAEAAGWGYGSVGSTGFHRPGIESRWHAGYRHSDFLTKEFAQTFWIPFLKGEKPRRADAAAPLPFWISTITRLPLRLLPPAILIFTVAFFALRLLQGTFPFNWVQPVPPFNYPPYEDALPRMTIEPDPKRQAFKFPNGDGGKGTAWEKLTSDTHISYWIERNPDGREPGRFIIDHRVAYDSECDGVVVIKEFDTSVQRFIPDRSQGCERHELAIRDGGYGNWHTIGTITETQS